MKFEKIKKFGSKIKTSVKSKPKLYGAIAAIIVVASGGSAAGVLETAALIQQVGEIVEVVSTVSE